MLIKRAKPKFVGKLAAKSLAVCARIEIRFSAIVAGHVPHVPQPLLENTP